MVVRGSRRRPRRERILPPAPELLRPEAIEAEVRRRALRRPSAVGSGLLFLAGLASAPVLGPPALAVGALGLLAGAGSWWSAVSGNRGRAAREARRAELEAAIVAARLDSLGGLADDFTYHGLHQGATQARELAEAWRVLTDAVGEGETVVSVELRRLADDGLCEGIRLLEAARDARAALESVDARVLQRELEGWQRERDRLEPTATELLGALEQRIGAHERRLSLLAEQDRAITRLLAEVEKLEGALHEAYLALIGRGTDAALNRPEDSAGELASAVEVAKRVAARVEALERL